MNAGHLGQTFAMAATAPGLGPFQTAAFADDLLEQLLDAPIPKSADTSSSIN